MVEGQRRRVGHREPGRVAGVGGRLHAVVADVDQGVVGHGDDPLAGVAFHVAEGVKLLKKDLRQAGLLLQFPPGGIFQRLVHVDESPRQGPFAGERVQVCAGSRTTFKSSSSSPKTTQSTVRAGRG